MNYDTWIEFKGRRLHWRKSEFQAPVLKMSVLGKVDNIQKVKISMQEKKKDSNHKETKFGPASLKTKLSANHYTNFFKKLC